LIDGQNDPSTPDKQNWEILTTVMPNGGKTLQTFVHYIETALV
jgi:hypothetical protein